MNNLSWDCPRGFICLFSLINLVITKLHSNIQYNCMVPSIEVGIQSKCEQQKFYWSWNYSILSIKIQFVWKFNPQLFTGDKRYTL